MNDLKTFLFPETLNENEFIDMIESPIDETIISSLESFRVVCAGLLSTPVERYRDASVLSSLKTRLIEIESVTGVSLEGIALDIEKFGEVTVSNENKFLDVISDIVTKILQFLEKVREFFKDLFKRIFGSKNATKATTAATNVTIKKAVSNHKTANKPLPTTVTVGMPGRCYLAFDGGARHTPKAGFKYSQKGFDKALKHIDADVNNFVKAAQKDTDVILSVIGNLVREMKSQNAVVSSNALSKLRDVKQLKSYYHNNFRLIGFSMSSRPPRHGGRYSSDRISLVNAVSTNGWDSVDEFDVTLDVSTLSDTSTAVCEAAVNTYTEIQRLVDSIANSKAVKELEDMLKDQRNAMNFSAGDDLTSTRAIQSANLEKLEIAAEQIATLQDIASRIYGFYGRYVTILTAITDAAAKELANNS